MTESYTTKNRLNYGAPTQTECPTGSVVDGMNQDICDLQEAYTGFVESKVAEALSDARDGCETEACGMIRSLSPSGHGLYRYIIHCPFVYDEVSIELCSTRTFDAVSAVSIAVIKTRDAIIDSLSSQK